MGSRASRKWSVGLRAGAAIALAAAPSLADELTLVHTGTGSGTLGGVPFPESAFTITSIAEVIHRGSFFGGYYIDHAASRISIAGVAEVEVYTPTRTFVHNLFREVGYSRAGKDGENLFNGPGAGPLAEWDMTTEIGPIRGEGQLLLWSIGDIDTTGGILIFDDGLSRTTFTATFERPCYPDCDTTTGPEVLDIFDFLCFQNRYDAGAPYACDCDQSTGPGVCDIFDFLCFQNEYDQGCP